MSDWQDKNIPEKCRDCEFCEKYTDLYTPYYMSYWKYSCKNKHNCKKQVIMEKTYKRAMYNNRIPLILRIIFFYISYPFRKHDNSPLVGTSYHSFY